MTVLNGKVRPTLTSARSTSQVVPSASVWDLGGPERLANNISHVRTLRAENRTSIPTPYSSKTIRKTAAERFESRREVGATLLAGSLLGMSLIIGGAFGGVFEPVTPQAPVDYVAEITPGVR